MSKGVWSDGSDFPAEADVVVIGTGAFGLAVTWHLSQLAVQRVVALDQNDIGSETSPQAAGLFKLIQADPLRSELAQLAVDLIKAFSKETGIPLPYVPSGSLLVARTEQHAQLIADRIRVARSWGVEAEHITTEEACQIAPYLEKGALLGVAYIPGDTYIEEPKNLLEALQKAAEQAGTVSLAGVRAIKFVMENGRIVAVHTPAGAIRTRTVVDAAGAWVRSVSRLAGVDLPVLPVRHQLAITEPIPGVEATHPIVRIVDGAVYVRPRRAGLMWGGFESEPEVVSPTLPSDFRIEQMRLDFTVLEQFASGIRDTVPVLYDASVQEHRGGLFTMTADGRFLVGPVPGVGGLWVVSGCNGNGFSFSIALGKILAEWVVEGRPSIAVDPFHPSRSLRHE